MDAGRPHRLVIFDCDGVLVDSEPISIAVLLEAIAGAGGRISEEMAYARFLGRSMASIRDMLVDEFAVVMTDRHLADMRGALYRRFRAELRPVPGVAEALAAIPGPRCVASSSQPDRIRLCLEVTGLLDHFSPHLYSSTMVTNGKPAPDLFLHAAAAMGADPADCIVIEDSPAGVEAARRAGMRVFAFTGGAHAGAAAIAEAMARQMPDLVFDDMRDLPALLRRQTAESA